MTPQEKAQARVLEHAKVILSDEKTDWFDQKRYPTLFKDATNCALLTIEREIDSVEKVFSGALDGKLVEANSHYQYLNKIKEELKKMLE